MNSKFFRKYLDAILASDWEKVKNFYSEKTVLEDFKNNTSIKLFYKIAKQ